MYADKISAFGHLLLLLKEKRLGWKSQSGTMKEFSLYKCLEAECHKKHLEKHCMCFIHSAKSPSTKIDGSLVNVTRRLSNWHVGDG